MIYVGFFLNLLGLYIVKADFPGEVKDIMTIVGFFIIGLAMGAIRLPIVPEIIEGIESEYEK